MPNNGALLDSTGDIVKNIGHWQPPPNSVFFGWLDEAGGFCTVRVEEISAITTERDGRFKLWLKPGQLNMILPTSDGFALMQRLGWRQTPGLPTKGN